jgi:hypothetical protein
VNHFVAVIFLVEEWEVLAAKWRGSHSVDSSAAIHTIVNYRCGFVPSITDISFDKSLV